MKPACKTAWNIEAGIIGSFVCVLLVYNDLGKFTIDWQEPESCFFVLCVSSILSLLFSTPKVQTLFNFTTS